MFGESGYYGNMGILGKVESLGVLDFVELKRKKKRKE